MSHIMQVPINSVTIVDQARLELNVFLSSTTIIVTMVRIIVDVQLKQLSFGGHPFLVIYGHFNSTFHVPHYQRVSS